MSPSQPRPRRPATRGRPRKFREPARPVTVTLPERTLKVLGRVHHDRARAIVAVSDAFGGGQPETSNGVEIVAVTDSQAVIVIPPCPPLDGISRLRTIEIAPSRLLLTIEPGTPTEMLEVEIADLLDAPQCTASDGVVLRELLRILRLGRRERAISKAEILFVSPLE